MNISSPAIKRPVATTLLTVGLVLAGIDLKITPDEEVYCFEVNPCPAFSFYELSTGQPISEGIARRLCQMQ